MSSPAWFALRGEEYMYDQGKWWRKWKPKVGDIRTEGLQFKLRVNSQWDVVSTVGTPVSEESAMETQYRVPCSQPFQVGDRVKVVRAKEGNPKPVFLCVGLTGDVDYIPGCGNLLVKTSAGRWCFGPDDLEPAPVEPSQPEPVDPGEGWEIYEPKEKEPYSPGTQYRLKDDPRDNWDDQETGGTRVHGDLSCDNDFIYRRPKKPDYVPPDGWLVKRDDEVVTKGDAFSHTYFGDPWEGRPNDNARILWGETAKAARSNYMPNGGYILTPVTTPQTVGIVPHWFFQGASCPVDECEGRIVNVIDAYRSPGYWLKCSECGFSQSDAIDLGNTETQQAEPHKPLDIHLPTIESKVLAHPALRDWWFTRKMELAAEANGKIEEVTK